MLITFLLLSFVSYFLDNGDPGVICAGGLLNGLLGGIFGGVTSGLSSGISGAVSSVFQPDSMEQQKELMDYQYDKQKEFVDYQNEYNTPANQLDRFEQAGVNPNLAMNFGLGSAGNSSYEMPNPAPTRQSADFRNLMADSWLKQNQSSLQAALVKSEDSFRDSKLEKLMLENNHQQLANDYQEMYNEIYKEFGRSKYAADLQKDLKAALALDAQAYDMAMSGDLKGIDKLFAFQDKYINVLEKQLSYKFNSITFNDRVESIRRQMKEIAERINTEKAKQSDLYASAGEHRSAEQLNYERKEFQDLENAIKRVERDNTVAAKQDMLDALRSTLQKQGRESLLQDQEIQRKIEVLNKAKSDEWYSALDNMLIYFRERGVKLPSIGMFVSPR